MIELTVDRKGWAKGPWDDEPDRLEWRMSEPPGYPCLIVRNKVGSLCGYVGVPPGHVAYGKRCDDELLDGLIVHGGLTYSDKCQGHICHEPGPDEPADVWWLGFDTGHAWDVSPGIEALLNASPLPPNLAEHVVGMGGTYRDIAYVRREVDSLARQLAQLK